jgi:hypothetical protein
MNTRFPPLSIEEIHRRLVVDCDSGRCFWKDATKHHAKQLNGKEAGYLRAQSNGNGGYWMIKINGIPYKRSQIIIAIATGRWPMNCVDHISGDKVDDRAINLRHATVEQNAWNHRTRAKTTGLPMGIRQLPSGKYQARIACNKTTIHIGTFDGLTEAHAAYQQLRKELFREYSGL